MSIQCRAAAPPAGVGTGAVAGILKSVAQLLHLTFFPRAVSGTTRMLRHLRLGHIMRIVLTGPIVLSPKQVNSTRPETIGAQKGVV